MPRPTPHHHTTTQHATTTTTNGNRTSCRRSSNSGPSFIVNVARVSTVRISLRGPSYLCVLARDSQVSLSVCLFCQISQSVSLTLPLPPTHIGTIPHCLALDTPYLAMNAFTSLAFGAVIYSMASLRPGIGN